jgi:hypothetical protein
VQYCVASAIDPASAEVRFVIVGSDEVLHHEASRGLEFLLALGDHRTPSVSTGAISVGFCRGAPELWIGDQAHCRTS